MKNSLTDLNNYLFAQLERLNDEESTGDKLDEEINKARAVCEVAERIVANGALLLKGQIAKDCSIGGRLTLPKMMED